MVDTLMVSSDLLSIYQLGLQKNHLCLQFSTPSKRDTPWKLNMEPENHLFEKGNHLPNLHFWVQNVNFQGCTNKKT